MSGAGFSVAVARLFAVNDCQGAALDAVRAAMDAVTEPGAKAAVWDSAKPILMALDARGKTALAEFYKAKQEAGL